MITILGGDIICALGDKEQRLKHLSDGTYQTTQKKMNLFTEERHYPYYPLSIKHNYQELFDPIPVITPVIEKLIAKLALDKTALSRCGLFLGCSANDLSISHPLWLNISGESTCRENESRVGNGLYAAQLVELFSLNSLSLTYNTACTSSANAMIDASTMLEAGLIDYALIVGLEMFASLSFEGFSSMQLLATDQVSPFDKDRQGMVLGESLSALIMSRDDICPSDWIFKGGINRSEVASVTGSQLDGSGIKDVISQTLNSCQLRATDITAIKTHGTGSPMGDVAEINGMKLIFDKQPDFFSFKPYIGHTLGSCGVSELLLLMECVEHDFIPATPNFTNSDPELQWQPITNKKHCNSGHFLLNYFGFGGNNASLIIEKVVQ